MSAALQPAHPALEIAGLTVVHRGRSGATRTLLDGVDLALAPGEVTAIVGESGSGKTLTARAVVGLLPRGCLVTAGRIRLGTTALDPCRPESLRAVRGRRVGMVFQEPMSSLNPALRIETQLTEGLRRHLGCSRFEARQRALAMLERVRIPDPGTLLKRYPHEFSGGMRQRIMLAGALLPEPELLIADEPTTALDVLVQREVLDLMLELVRGMRTSLLLVTHDLGVVARYASSVYVMRQGRVVEHGAVARVLRSPRQQYTRTLLASAPCALARETGAAGGEVLLEVRDLMVSHEVASPWRFTGTRRRILHGIDLTVRAGETVAVVGESGSGKTTLARSIVGLCRADTGTIRFAGETLDLRRMRPGLRRELQMVFQDPAGSLDPRMRIEEIIAEALDPVAPRARPERRERIAQLLAEVGLPADCLRRYPHELSGGQRQRVSIARAIAIRPRLIVADEPVSALDLTIQAQILRLLEQLKSRRSLSYLFITHDLSVVRAIADRVLVLYRGHVVERGATDAVLGRPAHPYTRRLIEAVLRIAAEEEPRAAPCEPAEHAGLQPWVPGESPGVPVMRRLQPWHEVLVSAPGGDSFPTEEVRVCASH